MTLSLRKTLLTTALVAAAALPSTSAQALNIVLRADSSFTSQPGGADALFAFRKAANYWNKTLTNDATLYFNISYAPLAPNTIAQAGSNSTYATVSSIYNALAANSVTPLDQIAVANLRPLTAAGGLGYRMPDSVTGIAGTGNGLGLETATRGSVYDNDDTDNNLYAYANTANLKALGIKFDTDFTDFGDNSDADLTFSSAFNFDFDPTDGITPGTQDFISVAVHEMGHALGFVSGTDLYDFYANPNGPGRNGPYGNSYNWDDQPVLSVLDLFRASTNPPSAAGWDPVTGLRYLQLDPNRGAGFSIDGKTFFNQDVNFAEFSTGRYNGDGEQASHWVEGRGFYDENGCFFPSPAEVGIMDPTSGDCQVGFVTGSDLAAFDAIGYNLNFDILKNQNYVFTTRDIYNLAGLAAVPEPALWAQLILGFGVIGGTLRRTRARKVSVTYA